MSEDEAKACKKGDRVVAHYDDGPEQHGQVDSNDKGELVIKWDNPPAVRSRAPHVAW